MKRALLIFTLCLAGFGLSACNEQQQGVIDTVGQAVAQGVAPTLQPGQLSGTLAALGVSATKQAAINTAVADAQAAALRACKILPLGEGFANLAIAALASGIAPTAEFVQAKLNVLCDRVNSAPTYMSYGRNSLVKVWVHMGNYDVPVYAYRR